MKRLLFIIVLAMLTLFTTACMQEDEYYTRTDVDSQFTEVQNDFDEVEALIDQLRNQIDTQNALIDDLNDYIEEVGNDARKIVLTQLERYIFDMLTSSVVGMPIVFATVGGTYTGTVPNYDYYLLVFEVYREITVEIEIIQAAPNGDWNLDVYSHDGQLDDKFEEIENGDKFIITFYPGFNTLEFDSYLTADYDFIIKVTEVI